MTRLIADVKPKLGDLRKRLNEGRETPISIADIAQRAKLEIGFAYTVDVGGYVTEEIATKVVRAFNILSHKNISLSDIQVKVIK